MGMPVLQLILFGYAINLNLRYLPAAVADQSQTAGSRAAVQDLLASDVIQVNATAQTPQQLVDLLREGRISVGVAIPPDFERRKLDGREAIQVMVDGSDNVVQSAAGQLAQYPLNQPESFHVDTAPPISVVSFYNPERRSAVNIVPGLIGVVMSNSMLPRSVSRTMATAVNNMELLITTPVSRTELMIGKVLPYAGIGLIQTTLVLLLGSWLFQVPIRGSLWDVYMAASLLVLANLSLGLLISTRAKSQFQAMQMTFFVFLPSILLSGFMFPFAGMPVPAQWIAELLPLTHFNRLIRGIMLRGADFSDLWPDSLALLAFIAVMLTLSIRMFHKRLD
jgi:ABC-2 type transport system permease protein